MCEGRIEGEKEWVGWRREREIERERETDRQTGREEMDTDE